MKRTQQGFTLIELMIVVAIIGILAAIAIPAYQDYTIRAQASEGMSLADGAKTALSEYYNDHGDFPTSNASAGLAKDTSINGNYVTQVDAGTAKGVIEITYGNGANTALAQSGQNMLTISAITSSGSVKWVCGGKHTTVLGKYLPSSCRH